MAFFNRFIDVKITVCKKKLTDRHTCEHTKKSRFSGDFWECVGR